VANLIATPGNPSTEPVLSEVEGLGMTQMGWVLENSKLSIHNDFRDAPHAQTIAVNPAIETHDLGRGVYRTPLP